MSRVYVNNQLVKEKAYGFTAFHVLLDDYIKLGENNEIKVTANVPETGHNRWYTGGGIYRPVNLYTGEKNYIDIYGLKIKTLSTEPAKIQADISLHGGGDVALEILKDNKRVAYAEKTAETGFLSFTLDIPNAKLWSADTPELYTAKAVLTADGKTADIVTETFGIRTVTVDSKKGLIVNGKPVVLRGGCIHNDNGVIGVINNDSTELHRAKIIKASGFNAVRSAHHPMSRSLMKACDEVGLYVMDEAFDYWYRMKHTNPHCGVFPETFKEDTAVMVQDAYNHPSVIIYSIGNEIPEAGGVKGVRIGKEIVDTIHSIDTSRLTTLCPSVHWLREYLDQTPYLTTDEDEWIAASPENKDADWKHYIKIFMGAALNLPDNEKDVKYPLTYQKADEDATKNLYPYLDIAGYNYYEDKYEELHNLHPERVILGTETRGVMIVNTARFIKNHPYVIGDFIWTLQEHLGEANCCGIHYEERDEKGKDVRFIGKDYPWLTNYGGVIDLIGTILPSNHLHEFAWEEEKHGLYLAAQPPIHDGIAPKVESYRWTDTIDGWTFEGCEDQKTWVDIYTDAAEAEILINGLSVGKTKVTDYYAKIPCTYSPGELVGIGYDENGKELYRTVVKTAGKETRLTVHSDRNEIYANGEDFCFISVDITDDKGNPKQLPEREITVTIEGEGILQGFGSANPINAVPFDKITQKTYFGKLLAVIRSTDKSGEIKAVFHSEGLSDAELVIHSLPVAAQK